MERQGEEGEDKETEREMVEGRTLRKRKQGEKDRQTHAIKKREPGRCRRREMRGKKNDGR